MKSILFFLCVFFFCATPFAVFAQNCNFGKTGKIAVGSECFDNVKLGDLFNQKTLKLTTAPNMTVEYKIMNSSGRVLMTGSVVGEKDLDISSLPNDMYVFVTSYNNDRYGRQFVINRGVHEK